MSGKITFVIAQRNIRKHPGKNFLVGIMVFLSTMIFLFTASVVHNSRVCWRDFFSGTTTGYLNVGVVGGNGKDMTSPEFRFPERVIPDELTGYLDKNNIAYSKRIRLGGIKYNFEAQKFDGDDNTFDIIGCDFEKEAANLTNLRITAGEYDPDSYQGAVVWKKIMKRYNLRIGDEISFFINDSEGSPMPYSFLITGVCENISGNNLEVESDSISNPVIFVKYSFLADKLGLENGSYTEAAIWDRSEKVTADVRSIAKKHSLEFFFADEAYVLITSITGFIGFLGGFVALMIMLIFVVTTTNLNTMGFIDRQKEIATMLAIGSRPSWIISILMCEMILFCVTALILSAGLYSAFALLAPQGISFGELGIIFSDRNFRFTTKPADYIMPAASVIGAMTISLLYPSLLTCKMNPVEIFKEGNL